MSLWLHGKEDYISEAGAMNMWIIKQVSDDCTFILHPSSLLFPFLVSSLSLFRLDQR